ncbi:MAG: DUF4007 family protein [bacterium]|nr:DUF4007 family protein [bacterium]
MGSDRLGTVFHESFSLSRQSITQIIKTVNQYSKFSNLSQSEREKIFQGQTSLGTRYIKAMPRYAIGTGMIDTRYMLRPLGKFAFNSDQLLDHIGTIWLMHYHLSAPHGPGPTFWNDLVVNRFFTNSIFSGDEISEQIGNFIWKTENKILSERSVRSTATIFLGSYTKPEGLGKLRILEITGSGRYQVRNAIPAPIWAVGYALLDYWQSHYPGRITIGLDTLHDSEFMKLFMLGKADLEAVLLALQEAKYIEFYRSVQPYQIVLLRQDSEPLLKRLYGAN